MQFLTDIKNIFYPNTCHYCETVLNNQETILCTGCLYNLPVTNFIKTNNNSVKKIFFGRIKIENATALLYFTKRGITQELIHNLKYRGHEEIGVFLGKWIGKELKNNGNYTQIDCIIPVPLHEKRFKKRGYNQVTKFGEELSKTLRIPFVENVLIRKSASHTQTKKTRLDRLQNVSELFFLDDVNKFKNKHILLIDDIITTGATIEACSNELFRTENIKISVVAMAITQ